MTGYVVHYSDGVTNMTESVPASSTSSHITNLTNCYNYSFSVEAVSEHLSGISAIFMLQLGIAIFMLHTCFVYNFVYDSGAFQLAVNVTAEAVSSTVISVKWDYLRACGQFDNNSSQVDNVNFTVQYTDNSSDERGNINLTRQLIVTTTNAQITGLMPYTNYSIKVAVVVNDIGDTGPYSYPLTVQTSEDGTIINVWCLNDMLYCFL